MPRKIPFSVIYASSTNEGYNSKELEIHNPLVKGWVGGRFCLYPQEIVLRMPDKTRIRKLQLLAHQYLISTKIEFYVGSLPPDHINSLSGQRYRRLGYVTLSDNEKTGYKARELKSVHVDAVGKYLRLVIYKNYVNKYNLYNQVGLVAVNIIGDEVGDDGTKQDGPNSRVNDVINQHMPPGQTFDDKYERSSDEVASAILGGIGVHNPDYISPMDDLAFDMYQDPEVANIIRKLDTKKNEAVLQEKFDLAKQLKLAITDLQKVGERLGRYEVEKRRAIETEDYDVAKIKKIQMDEYRLSIYKHVKLYDLLEMTKPDGSQADPTPKDMSPRREEPAPIKDLTPPPPPEEKPAKKTPRDAPLSVPPNPFMYNADDRPLPALKNSPHDDHGLPPVEVPEAHHDEAETGAVLGGSSPRGVDEGDQMVVPISEKNMRELDVASEIFGRDKVMKIYSKSWALRGEGLGDVRLLMDTADGDKGREEMRAMLRSAIFLATKGLKDKVFSVFNSAVELARYAFVQFIPKYKLGKGETSQAVDRVVPELLPRIGDTNAKLKSMDIDFIVEMASFHEVRPLQTIPNQCQTPFKTNTQARMAATRVEIVEKLLKELGVDKNSGITTTSVMKFATRALEHTTGIVREAAINLIFELYKVKGSEVRDHLPSTENPSTLKNPLYARIYDGLDKIDGKPTKTELKAQAKAAKVNERKAKQAEIDALQSQLAELRATAQVQNKGSDRNKEKTESKAPNKKIPPRAPSIADASEFGDDMDQQCIFCVEKDPDFKTEGLDMHYWKFCPMLTKCKWCKQVVEISGFTEHLLTECEKRADFAKCPRCSEAHSKAEIDGFVAEKKCEPVKPGSARCPLCHTNIAASEESWKKHLMGKEGCKESKRREQAIKRNAGKGNPKDAAGSSKDKTAGKQKQPIRRDKAKAGKMPRAK